MSELKRHITQDILYSEENQKAGIYGNCMQAAVATILDRELLALPNFALFAWWPGALRLWLRGEGLDYTRVTAPPIPMKLAMLCGKSPRGTDHAVVSRSGEIIWDPHPSRAGLLTPKVAFIIHEWRFDSQATDPTDKFMEHVPELGV